MIWCFSRNPACSGVDAKCANSHKCFWPIKRFFSICKYLLNLFFQASMISSLLWLDAFKRFCTAISSISISPRFWRARSYNFQLKNANNHQGFIRKQRGHATIFTWLKIFLKKSITENCISEVLVCPDRLTRLLNCFLKSFPSYFFIFLWKLSYFEKMCFSPCKNEQKMNCSHK